jgi:autotransporter-associated beta strand protein
MGSGGLIDVQAGTLVGGTHYRNSWTNNLASLNVAGGALFQGVESNVIVAALTGSGQVSTGYGAGGSITVGANNASSTYNGSIVNNDSGSNGSITKIGTGTITLAGTNTYTGATTVSAGT